MLLGLRPRNFRLLSVMHACLVFEGVSKAMLRALEMPTNNR